MTIIEGLYYTEDHEWVKLEDNKAYVGITDYAQHSMGDIVFVELPEVDDTIVKSEQCGVLESVKAAADILAPVNGTVLEVNESLEDEPELLNEDPYGAYIFVVTDFDKADLDQLMNADSYKSYCTEEK